MMDNKKRTLKNKILYGLMCSALLSFISYFFGIRFVYLSNIAWSLIFFTVAIFTLERRPNCIIRSIVLLVTVIVLFAFATGIVTQGDVVQDPISKRQFLASVNMDFRGGGSITYYERRGIFFTTPQEFTSKVLALDYNYISISDKGIYVNVTFMGNGAHFPLRSKIPDWSSVTTDKIILKKQYNGKAYVFEIANDNLSIRSLGESTIDANTISISMEQYREIRNMLSKEAPLTNLTDIDYPKYYIDVYFQNRTSTRLYVDGEHVFNELLAIMDILE